MTVTHLPRQARRDAGPDDEPRRAQERPAPEQARMLAATIGNQAFASLARTAAPLPHSRARSAAAALRGVRAQVDRRSGFDARAGSRSTSSSARLRGHLRRHGRDGRRLVRVGPADDRPRRLPGPGRGTREEVEYVLAVEIHGKKDREKDFCEAGPASRRRRATTRSRRATRRTSSTRARATGPRVRKGAVAATRGRQADGRRRELPRQPPQRPARGGARGQRAASRTTRRCCSRRSRTTS